MIRPSPTSTHTGTLFPCTTLFRSMFGGLGCVFLPIAFGLMNDLVGIWSSCFILLFVIALVNLLWMHFAILRMDRSRHPEIKADTDLPEIMATVIDATRRARDAAEAAGKAASEARAAATRLRS